MWRRYLSQKKRVEVLVWLIMLTFGVVFVGVSVINHWRLMTFGWDLGFYDQAVWQVAHGRFPYSSLMDEWFLAVRWSPIIFLWAPGYWWWSGAEVLLVGQAVVAALGAWPMYLLGKELGRGGSGRNQDVVGLAAVVSYLSFFGLQRAVFFDFHPDTVMAFIISWLLWFKSSGNMRGVWVMAIMLLMCKEWAGLLLAAIGMMFWVENLRYRVTSEMSGQTSQGGVGWRLVVTGVVGFAVTMGLVVWLGGRDTPVFEYGELGSTPLEVAMHGLKNPRILIEKLVWPEVKLMTWIGTLASFGWLPVLAPTSLIPVVVQMAVRFWDESHQQSWLMRFHYSAPLTPLLVYGSLLAVHKFRRKGLIVGLWIGVSLVSMKVYHAPVFSVLKPAFYTTDERVVQIKEMMAKIPKEASVAAQNNLVAQISTRNGIYPLPRLGEAEFVVVDLAAGQSDYNFSTATRTQIANLVNELVEKRLYMIDDANDGFVLLVRRK